MEVIEPGSPTSVVAVWRIVETHKDIMYDSQCTVLWEDKKEYDCILLFSGMSLQNVMPYYVTFIITLCSLDTSCRFLVGRKHEGEVWLTRHDMD